MVPLWGVLGAAELIAMFSEPAISYPRGLLHELAGKRAVTETLVGRCTHYVTP